MSILSIAIDLFSGAFFRGVCSMFIDRDDALPYNV